MFVGCFEISLSVIVKHVQNIGIIRPFCLLRGTCEVFHFSAWGGQKKLLGYGLLERGISTQGNTMGSPICLEGNVIANSKMYPQ